MADYIYSMINILNILNAKSEFRHHNIILYGMKNEYSFWDLLKILCK